MPRIEHKTRESQGGGADQESGNRHAAGEKHPGRVWGVEVVMSAVGADCSLGGGERGRFVIL